MSTMTKIELIDKLLALPEVINMAECNYIQASKAASEAKERLAQSEWELIESGKIDGKNAELRAGQLRNYTIEERADLDNLLSISRIAEAELNRLKNEFKACRSVASIVGVSTAI